MEVTVTHPRLVYPSPKQPPVIVPLADPPSLDCMQMWHPTASPASLYTVVLGSDTPHVPYLSLCCLSDVKLSRATRAKRLSVQPTPSEIIIGQRDPVVTPKATASANIPSLSSPSLLTPTPSWHHILSSLPPRCAHELPATAVVAVARTGPPR